MKYIVRLLKICVIIAILCGCDSEFSQYISVSRKRASEAERYLLQHAYNTEWIRYATDTELESVNMRFGTVVQMYGEETLCWDIEECDKAYIFEYYGNDIREHLRSIGYIDIDQLFITLHTSPLEGILCKNDILLLIYPQSLNYNELKECFLRYCEEDLQYLQTGLY